MKCKENFRTLGSEISVMWWLSNSTCYKRTSGQWHRQNTKKTFGKDMYSTGVHLSSPLLVNLLKSKFLYVRFVLDQVIFITRDFCNNFPARNFVPIHSSVTFVIDKLYCIYPNIKTTIFPSYNRKQI